MGDVKKIVSVSITRETNYPSGDNFGIGGIIASFVPGELNTPMQGANGRYKKYTSLSVMEQDGWDELDPIYMAARTYFAENPRPKSFIVGLRKDTDADWAETLNAVKADNNDWFGFSVIFSEAELATPTTFTTAVKEVADWTEDEIKLFLFSTAQNGADGNLVLISSGYFTSGKPGVLANFQTIDDGQFGISKDGAAVVAVKDINLTASATPGEWETGSIAGNLANFQAISDGEFSLNLDSGGVDDVTGIDLTSATSFASVASLVEAAVQGVTGLEGVTVRYDSDAKKLVFTSDSTGTSSTVILATVSAGAGTDLTGEDYFNGGESEPGKAGGSVASYADVATALETAITAAGVSGVTVAYNATDLRFIFTSSTEGKTSSVEISALTGEVGDDLTAADYLNGGVLTYGTNAGAIPGTDDIGTELKSQYDRTGWVFHEKARDAENIDLDDINWIEFAWVAQIFGAYDPAEATWAFKNFDSNDYIEVSGISNEADEFIRNNNGNTYTLTGGSNITYEGKVCGGEYFDIMRGTDWLTSLLVEYAYKPLVENPKLPLTDPGIGVIEGQIRAALTAAELNLINASATELTIPKADEISAADKAERAVYGFEFNSTYQGAIQKVGITGTIGL